MSIVHADCLPSGECRCISKTCTLRHKCARCSAPWFGNHPLSTGEPCPGYLPLTFARAVPAQPREVKPYPTPKE
jgi:hypothetical protein